MFSCGKLISFTCFAVFCVYSKTIRSKIYTNENGIRELILGDNSNANQGEIETLVKNLNFMNITNIDLKIGSTTSSPIVKLNGKEKTQQSDKLKEKIFKSHWNALTEIGWKNFSNSGKEMQQKSTRILKINSSLSGRQTKELNSTGDTTRRRQSKMDDDASADLCSALRTICQVPDPATNLENLTSCLSTKNKTLLRMVEQNLLANGNFLACSYFLGNISYNYLESENSTSVSAEKEPKKSNSSVARTFIRPRRILQKILLPLLVLIVIKYLITLPFVAVTVFTINTMWLALLSLGAAFFAKYKNHDRISYKVATKAIYPHGPPTEIYNSGDVLPPTEILWSPIRVPLSLTGSA